MEMGLEGWVRDVFQQPNGLAGVPLRLHVLLELLPLLLQMLMQLISRPDTLAVMDAYMSPGVSALKMAKATPVIKIRPPRARTREADQASTAYDPRLLAGGSLFSPSSAWTTREGSASMRAARSSK